MNIQEAYNKGLTDAEDSIHKAYTNALENIDSGALANPKMEELRRSILDLGSQRGDEQLELTLFRPVDEDITKIINGEDVELAESSGPIVVFKELMEHFIELSERKNNVGKAFAKILKEKRDTLTSQ